MPVLESYRGRDIIGVEELATVATSLVEHYGRESARSQLRLVISPRTVRQYLAEQLLGEPTGQTGASTVFNYGNLLRLLAVKKLLSDHWSVVKIKEFMRAMDITALEELVNTALTSTKASRNDTGAAAEAESGRSLRAAEPTLPDGAQDSAQSKLFPASSQGRRQERAITEWVEIAPGLEIKVRRSFRPPASEEERARLAMRFWSVIMKDEG
jgi:hypothetical protein